MGVLKLEGAIESIGPDGIVALLFGGEMGIIGRNALPQGLRLLAGQGRGLAVQRIQQHLAFHFLASIVGESQRGIGKMQPVPLLIVADTDQLGNIAVGNVVRSLQVVPIVILHHHQTVSAAQFLLPVQHLGADAGIVPNGALVGAAEHRHLIGSVLVIGLGKRLQELSPADTLDIGQGIGEAQVRELNGILHGIQHNAKMGGIDQDPGIGSLAHHGGQSGKRDPAKSGHILRRKRRRSLQTHRRELRGIAHQNEAAVHAGSHKRNQIGQQIARSKSPAAVRGSNANERHLVYNEQSIAGLVGRQGELAHSIGPKRFLPVDMLMDGRGRFAAIAAQNLGRTPGRSQQNARNLQRRKPGNHRSQGRCLTRTRIAVHHQDIALVGGQKGRNLPQKLVLAGSGFIGKTAQKRLIQKARAVH